MHQKKDIKKEQKSGKPTLSLEANYDSIQLFDLINSLFMKVLGHEIIGY